MLTGTRFTSNSSPLKNGSITIFNNPEGERERKRAGDEADTKRTVFKEVDRFVSLIHLNLLLFGLIDELPPSGFPGFKLSF